MLCVAESSAADLQQLCGKCDGCFTDGVATFQSISDDVNMALLHSNHGKLMRLQVQSIASRLGDTKKREFTNAERNYFMQVSGCFMVITTTAYYYFQFLFRSMLLSCYRLERFLQ